MKQVVIAFGLLVTALMLLFQLAQWRIGYAPDKVEWIIAGFSLLFLAIGIVLSRKLFSKTVIITESKITFAVATETINPEKLQEKGLSKREAEIMELINDGLSNQQIGEKLFISEHTVKKHISNIFLKLNVERRTEAVKRAKELSS